MTDRKELIIVYAGRREDKFLYYEIIDNKIGHKRIFGKCLFLDKTIGAVFRIEENGESVFYSSKQKAEYLQFDNRSILIQTWKLEDSIVEKKIRAKKELKDTHKFESIREFKKWYQSKSPIEKQYILSDLVYFLNNRV